MAKERPSQASRAHQASRSMQKRQMSEAISCRYPFRASAAWGDVQLLCMPELMTTYTQLFIAIKQLLNLLMAPPQHTKTCRAVTCLVDADANDFESQPESRGPFRADMLLYYVQESSVSAAGLKRLPGPKTPCVDWAYTYSMSLQDSWGDSLSKMGLGRRHMACSSCTGRASNLMLAYLRFNYSVVP